MRKFENIIQSEITPSTNSLHLKDGALFYYNNGKWKPISSGPNAPSFVGCTEEEYNSLESKDSNILYVINSNSGIDALYAGKNKVWKKPSNRFAGRFSTDTQDQDELYGAAIINGDMYSFLDKVNPDTGEFDFEYEGPEIRTLDFSIGQEDEPITNRSLKSIISIPKLSESSNSIVDFSYCGGLNSVNPGILDTSRVTDFSNMFSNCYNLKDLSEFIKTLDTNNAVDMSYMFCDCSSLQYITRSYREKVLDFHNVIRADSMFMGCKNLEYIHFLNFDDLRAESINYIFDGCTKLNYMPGNFWGVMKNAKYMRGAFRNTSLYDYLSDIEFCNAVDTSEMFKDCKRFPYSISFSFSSPYLCNISEMFSGCSTINSIIIDFTGALPRKVTDLFAYCTDLEHVTLKNLNLIACDTPIDMFRGCTKQITLEGDITNINQSIYLQHCRFSMNSIIKGLSDRSNEAYDEDTYSIIVNQSTYDSLTDEQRSAILAKRWTIRVASESEY